MNYYVQIWPTPEHAWIARVWRKGLIVASVDGLFNKRAAILEVTARTRNVIRAMRGKDWS